MDEEMKAIPGHENYFVSRSGVVLSRAWGKYRILAQWVNSNGYLTVKAGRVRHLPVHRAVALAWLPTLPLFTDVNHKDGNKLNNNVENLEWCSRSENIYHSLRNGLHDEKETPIVGTHQKTGHVVRFKSQADAGKAGFIQPNINKCLKALRRTHKGYAWRYDEDTVT